MNVERAFSRVREGVDALPVPDAGLIAARGRRRRARRLIVAGLAVIAVIVGGYSVWGSPAAIAPDPAASVSPSPGFTPPTANRAYNGRIPYGFLVHEENSTEPPGNMGASAGPCDGQPVQSWGVSRDVGEKADRVTILQSLFVYADEAAARQVMAEMRRRQVRTCLGFPDARVLKNDTPRWGDEAIGQTVALPADGANEHTGAPVRMVVLRVGRAVAQLSGYPEIPEIDQDAQAIVKRLCLYSAAGCVPPAGQPQPLRTLANGGEAWVAALAFYYEDDANARPGVSIAAAAERGYAASIVPVACDQGAHEALGLPSPTGRERYVAVYFRSREEAESLQPARGVFSVRTWCVPG
jgi:hypothetical protein